MSDIDPNTIDDLDALRAMVEELQAYTRMQDLDFEQRVTTEVEERIKAERNAAWSEGFDEGHDAGSEAANKDFDKHITEVRGRIDEALDMHLSDYTA